MNKMPARTIYTIEIINKIKPVNSKLTAIEFRGHRIAPCKKKTKLVFCQCECGGISTPAVVDVVNGISLTCGCLHKEITRKRSLKYYSFIRPIYNSWQSMKSRCYNVSNPDYHNYGGRGVRICDEWRNNFQNFLNWSIKNGWQEGLQIDKDVKGDGLLYSPETCQWVTPEQNCNNRRCCPKFFFKGDKYTISQLSRLTGVNYKLLYRRISQYKLSIEEAVSKPNKLQKFLDRKYKING